jgi:glycosyltransferase involved in cell wall biosynthesis
MPTLLSVLAINPYRIGSQEHFVRELSSQLGDRGWQSVVCYSANPTPPVQQFLALPNVRIEVLESLSTTSWETAKRMAALLRRSRPKILHLHFLGLVGPYPWMARSLSVEKIFFTDHTSRPANDVASRAPFWKRTAARFIDWPLSGVVSVSTYGYNSFVARDLLPRDRVRLIYNAVDVVRAAANAVDPHIFRKRHAIPDDAPLVIQVSQIIPEKGIPVLLKAAKLVVENDRSVRFAIVGEGSHREEYSRLAVQLGIQDNVIWTGVILDPLSEGSYAAADVVCQASDWDEVFGYVIAEAMASRRPVVATRVGGIPELIEDGRSGYLVARRDSEGLAARILELLRDPMLRDKMGRRAQEIARDKFDLRKNVTELLRFYGIAGG